MKGIVLKDANIILPDEDDKYLDEVLEILNIQIIRGKIDATLEEFSSALAVAKLCSGEILTLSNGKQIRIKTSEK